MKENRVKSVNIDVSGLKHDWQKEKATKCAEDLLLIMKSNMFKKLILNMDRDKWLKGESKGSIIHKMNNEEIYNHLMGGSEEWNGIIDYEIDLVIKGYFGKFWSKVVGYMNPGRPTIHVNYRFFNKFPPIEVASNQGHEWGHTMGSRHSGKYFKQAFCYYLNEVIETCYTHFIINKGEDIAMDTPVKIQEPKYKEVCTRSWKTLWFKRCKRIKV